MRGNDFGDYGIGLVLYFKFLKFMILLFLACSIFSIPSFVIFSGGYNPFTTDKVDSYY